MKLIVEGKRYDTDKMRQVIGRQQSQAHGMGLTLLGVWITRDNRVLVALDSIWESPRRDGTTIGVIGHFADEDEIARLASRYGGELESLVPEGE